MLNNLIQPAKHIKALIDIKSAMKEVSAAVMMIDRDFMVTYVNDASMRLFSEHADEFKTAFPHFDSQKIIGTCIDVFHREPSHQRKMLADTSKLPFKTDIRVGNLIIALYVTATYNEGKHTGNVLEWRDVTAERRKQIEDLDNAGKIAAIDKVMGAIEFDLNGKVLKVNANFAAVLGYSVDDMVGMHHSAFVDAAYKASPEYQQFWAKLNRGEFDSGVYKRIKKDGKEVWIQASYNPVRGVDGKPFKVVKYATDITQAKLQAADFEGQIAAIGKVMGVIEFDTKGVILSVNDIFANVTGYAPTEIVGKHHRMFVTDEYANSIAYEEFWIKLAKGVADSGQYQRVGKEGQEIWLEANYNPILDMNGKPFKVVKYATDITQQVKATKAMTSAIEQIQEVVLAAKQEDLSKRVPLEDKVGDVAILCEGVNQLVNNMAGVVVKIKADAAAIYTAVEQTQAVVNSAQAGDLTQRIPTKDKVGDIASLCAGVNSLVDNMAKIITQIKASSETINTAALEISNGNNDLSSRTEEQAASLEETASSMEELASTVKLNAENATNANLMAMKASETAATGGAVVDQVIHTMDQISSSSRKISDIIGVIDGIAFQTNILALNAAVEAARAGEQGRGFAVVASEVRNLAQRAATAAKEIKQLINDSVSEVENGTKLVETAGTTMKEIVDSVKRVTDIMSDIALASVEQSAGIDQVNTAVVQMDEVTQQNAALVEQSAAAAESLVEQANTMLDEVAKFNVGGVSNHNIRLKAVG